MSDNSYFRDFSAQVSQIVFLAYLTVLRLITTVWPEMSEKSYFRDFSAQVSLILFLAYLTVLRLITTVWPEMSEKSYLRDFSAQVSQSLFLAYLTALPLFKTVWVEISENLLLLRFQCTSITNRVLSLFDRFTACYYSMTWNDRKLISPRFQKTRISAVSVHKYHNSFS